MTVTISGTSGITTPGINNSSTLTQTGAVTASNTASFATTISVGAASPASTGAGVTFPASQSASSDANTLDDYEEGTWTPAITGGSGTTYTTQQGWYTKVGNLVTVGFEMILNAKGTITGGAAITGLPFTSGSAPARSSGSLSVANGCGTNYVSQGLFLDGSTTTIQIYAKTAAAASTLPPNGTDFYAASSQFIGSVSYHV